MELKRMENITESNWTRWNYVEGEPKFHQYWFENIDIDFWYEFGDSYASLIVMFTVFTYLGSVFWLKEYMKDKEPYRLRKSLFMWNTVVATFSIMALYRLGTELLYMMNTSNGFYRSVCLREGLHMSTAYWAVLIAFSKPCFVLDTLFLILRKKPVDAMHIIHHTLAIIFGPAVIRISEPMVRWMGLANLLVHSIDYPLLALRALKISVPKARHIMAALEIAQMLFVLFLSGYTLFLRATGEVCIRHPKSVLMTYVVYFGLLLSVGLTLLSPEYWKRGIKTMKGSADTSKKLK